MSLRQVLVDNAKNMRGWRTAEKLVVFSVDDYGAVRLGSTDAQNKLLSMGIPLANRFDQLDALETRQDLEELYAVLSSVSDSSGRNIVLTAYTLCANPCFEKINVVDPIYRYMSLPVTFDYFAAKHSGAYEGAWSLWKEGIAAGLIVPQFHGREHLNVKMFECKLKSNDYALLTNLANDSIAGLGSEQSMPGVGFTHAFGVANGSEIARHKEIIEDGLTLFFTTFGFRSRTFTPPAQKLHPVLYSFLESLSVQGIDKPRYCVRKIGRDQYSREFNTLGIRSGQNHVSLVRNVVFEPSSNLAADPIKLALDQIESAFRWRKPAIISSHRVNFGGHIVPENRRRGLDALRTLFCEIVGRWPDVKFVSADDLLERIDPTA